MRSPIPPIFTLCWIAVATAFEVRLPKCSSSASTTRLAMGGPQSQKSVQRPQNEFSRTVSPDQVLKLHGGKHSTAQNQRQYSVEIDANTDECQALAKRFQLPEITTLGANLYLSPEGRLDHQARGILVEGTAHATVIQTCVRTNEAFPQEMEFPIFTIVRPVEGNGPVSANFADSIDVPLTRSSGRKKRKNNRRKRQKDEFGEDVQEEEIIDPAELLKIQTMLEAAEAKRESSSSLSDDSMEDDIFEDAAIFATNQMLDVGELVSQLLWLQLDPYPRKPGGPEQVKFTISG